MKITLLAFCFSSFLSTASVAHSICVDLPTAVSYDSINNNFDGSITIDVPRVMADGHASLLSTGGLASDDRSDVGLCALMKKRLVDSTQDIREDFAVVLKTDGKLSELLGNANHEYFSSVTCR